MDVFNEVFTTTGRLNRRIHCKYQMIWMAFIVLATVTSSLSIEFLTGNPENDWAKIIGGVLFYIGMMGFFMIMTRRLHDLNLSGYFGILIFVPLIGVIFLFAIFLAKGQAGHNKYGAEPSTD